MQNIKSIESRAKITLYLLYSKKKIEAIKKIGF